MIGDPEQEQPTFSEKSKLLEVQNPNPNPADQKVSTETEDSTLKNKIIDDGEDEDEDEDEDSTIADLTTATETVTEEPSLCRFQQEDQDHDHEEEEGGKVKIKVNTTKKVKSKAKVRAKGSRFSSNKNSKKSHNLSGSGKSREQKMKGLRLRSKTKTKSLSQVGQGQDQDEGNEIRKKTQDKITDNEEDNDINVFKGGRSKSFEALEKCIEWLSYHPGEHANSNIANTNISNYKELTKRELLEYRQEAVRHWVDTLPESMQNNINNKDKDSSNQSSSSNQKPRVKQMRSFNNLTLISQQLLEKPLERKLKHDRNGFQDDNEITNRNKAEIKKNQQNMNENQSENQKIGKNVLNFESNAKTSLENILLSKLPPIQVKSWSNFATLAQPHSEPEAKKHLFSSHAKKYNENLTETETLTQSEYDESVSDSQLEVHHYRSNQTRKFNPLIRSKSNKSSGRIRKSRRRNISLWLSRMPLVGKCWNKLVAGTVEDGERQNVDNINIGDADLPAPGLATSSVVSDPGISHSPLTKDNDESDANLNIPAPARRTEDPNPFLTIDIEGKDNETVRKELNQIIKNMRIAGKLNDSGMTLSSENDYFEKNSNNDDDRDLESSSLSSSQGGNKKDNHNRSKNKNIAKQNKNRLSRKAALKRLATNKGQGKQNHNSSMNVNVNLRATESNSEEIQRLTNFLLNTRKSTMRTIFSLRKERIPPETPAPMNLLNRVGRQVQGFFTNTIHGYFRGGTSGLLKRVYKINPTVNHNHEQDPVSVNISGTRTKTRTMAWTAGSPNTASNNETESASASTTSSVRNSTTGPQRQRPNLRLRVLLPETNNKLERTQPSFLDTATRNSRGSLLKKILGLRKFGANTYNNNNNNKTNSNNSSNSRNNSSTTTAVMTNSRFLDQGSPQNIATNGDSNSTQNLEGILEIEGDQNSNPNPNCNCNPASENENTKND